MHRAAVLPRMVCVYTYIFKSTKNIQNKIFIFVSCFAHNYLHFSGWKSPSFWVLKLVILPGIMPMTNELHAVAAPKWVDVFRLHRQATDVDAIVDSLAIAEASCFLNLKRLSFVVGESAHVYVCQCLWLEAATDVHSIVESLVCVYTYIFKST